MPAKAEQPHVRRGNRQPSRVHLDGGVELQRHVACAGGGENQFDIAGIGGQRRIGLRDGAVGIGPCEDRSTEQGGEFGHCRGLRDTERRLRNQEEEYSQQAEEKSER